ncbi:MAG: hypothetical protein Q4G42_03620 [Neisseria sp.]|nr:hypothetical protein [Neisseria sp.]
MCKVDFSKLKQHLSLLNAGEKEAFSKSCGTTLGYIRKRISLGLPFGYEISLLIASHGVMKPEELMPLDHHKYVWDMGHHATPTRK